MPGPTGRGTDMMRHRLTISTPRRAAVIVTAALSLAGCGVSGGGTGAAGGTTTTGGDNKLIAMSRCMRAHGMSNFPDPTNSSGGGVGLSVTMTPGSSAVTVGGVTFSGPAFTAAEKACHFGAYGSKPKLTEAQQQGMLKSAECMRRHGVPGFPDPIFGPHGGVKTPSSKINHDSPAFEAAAKACVRVGMGIPGGG
ncbi:MAG TPA: hypothetical protein VGL69_22085 [Solirubrobacteraceae bacterium]